jgi:TonB family protein
LAGVWSVGRRKKRKSKPSRALLELDHPTEPAPPLFVDRQDEQVLEADDAIIEIWGQSSRDAVAPQAYEEREAPATLVDDLAPPTSLPFGSWDGPEVETADVSAKRASRHSLLEPTPSLMPALKAATRSRNRTAGLFIFVLLCLAGGAYALSVADTEEEVSVEASLASGTLEVGGALIAEGSALIEGQDDPEASQSGSRSQAAAGAEQPESEAEEQVRESVAGLGIAGGHGDAQEIGAEGIQRRAGRMVRSGDDALRERSRWRGRSTGGGNPLSSEQIMTSVSSNARTIRSCHEREMRRASMPIQGRVLVRIHVGRSGVVRTAEVLSGPPFGELSTCIERAVSTWRFPEATGETVIETPFVLASRQ